jgi:hypothetical protein
VKAITAYIMEVFLGLLLGIGIIYMKHSDEKKSVSCAVHHAFGVYADAAILLTFSVQLASVVILIKKDFGISANDFGGLTIEVTWAAALLTMLPMLLVCSSGADLDRKELRLSLICISWIFFLYTFISRMISYFGPSQVGVSKPGAVISPTEAANIQQLCWTDGSNLSRQETVAFDVFAIGGSLFLSIVVVGTLVWMLLIRRRPDMVERWRHSGIFTVDILNTMSAKAARLFMVFNIVLWAVPQLWAILRFREMQQALAASIRSSDQDNSWSFGQIVAVVIFLPVLVELVYVYMNGSPDMESKGNGHDPGTHNQSHNGAQNGLTFRNTM